ncbi:MAG: hypothetical protein ACM3O6_13625 [Acidobacteriota bacterium]
MAGFIWEYEQAMPAAKKRASLGSDLLDASDVPAADGAGARAKRRGERKRPALLDVAAPGNSEKPARAAETTLRQAMLAQVGTVFCKKGAASAAPFKPWYWTYEEKAGAEPQAAPVVALVAPTPSPAPEIEAPLPAELPEAFAEPERPVFPFEVPSAPPEPEIRVAEIAPPATAVPVVEDAVIVEARRHRTAFAEQLSAMIEGILATREFAALAVLRPSHARQERQALAGPAGLLPEPALDITPDSLCAELAQARPEPEPVQRRQFSLDRALLGASAIAIVAAGLAAVTL